MARIKVTEAKACYSGGGIYFIWGKVNGQNFLVDADVPHLLYIIKNAYDIDDENCSTFEWYEANFLYTVNLRDNPQLKNAIVRYFKSNQPSGNYQLEDIVHYMD